ncbi:MAG: glycosyltransferase [Acidobacteria bacterium]|nr:glycosyltransferase [Acidobacteriota bacterium]
MMGIVPSRDFVYPELVMETRDRPQLLFLSSLTSDSGSGVRFWNMARCAARAGAAVTFSERLRPGQPPRAERGIDYRFTTERGPLARAILRSLRDGLRLARGRQWDAVYALKPLPNAAIPALRARRRGTRASLDVDDLDFEYYPPGLARTLVRRGFEAWPRRFDTVSYHVEPLRAYLAGDARVPEDRLLQVPQGIDLDVFDAPRAPLPPAIEAFTGRWRTIVHMASLGITSDAEDLLPLFSQALRLHPDWGFLLLGHGVKLDAFRERVAASGALDRVLFAGHVPHATVPAVLAACRAGVHYLRPGGANRYRSIMKLREYLAAGLPVVANPSGDAADFAAFVEIAADTAAYLPALERALAGDLDERTRQGSDHVRRFLGWERLGPVVLRALGLA